MTNTNTTVINNNTSIEFNKKLKYSQLGVESIANFIRAITATEEMPTFIDDKSCDFILNFKKYEVKQEKKSFYTNNIVFEYSNYNKISGVLATQSDIWVHIFAVNENENEVWYIAFFNTTELKKELLESNFKKVTGGDDNASKMFLVPINYVFKMSSLLTILQIPKILLNKYITTV